MGKNEYRGLSGEALRFDKKKVRLEESREKQVLGGNIFG
jgi:hypothetical protein